MVPQRRPPYPPQSTSSSLFRLPPISLDEDPFLPSRGVDPFPGLPLLPPLPPLPPLRRFSSLISFGQGSLPSLPPLPPLPPLPSIYGYGQDPLFQPPSTYAGSRETTYTPSSSSASYPTTSRRQIVINCRCNISHSASSELAECRSCGNFSHMNCLHPTEREPFPFFCHVCIRPPSIYRDPFTASSPAPLSSSPSPPSSSSSGGFTEGGYDSGAALGTGRGGLPDHDKIFKTAADFYKYAKDEFESKPAGARSERKNGTSYVYLWCRNRRKKNGHRTGTGCQWEISAKQLRSSNGFPIYRLFSEDPVHNHACLQRVGQVNLLSTSSSSTNRTRRRLRSRAPSPGPSSSMGRSRSSAQLRSSTPNFSSLDERTRSAIDGLEMLSFPTHFNPDARQTSSRNPPRYSGWSSERNTFK